MKTITKVKIAKLIFNLLILFGFNKENIVFLPIFLYTIYVPLQFTLLKFNNIMVQ